MEVVYGPFRGADTPERLVAAQERVSAAWSRGKLLGWLRVMRRRHVGKGIVVRLVLEDLATRVRWRSSGPHIGGRSDVPVTCRKIAAATGIEIREVRRAVAWLRTAGWIWQDPEGRVWVGWG